MPQPYAEYRRAYWAIPENRVRQKVNQDARNHSDKGRTASRNDKRKVRDTVMQAYSGNPPHCACCGELQDAFLCMDHVNGGGSQHRKTMKRANIYQWLWSQYLKNGEWPTGFQVLCYNCNCAKGFRGTCPHTQEVT